LQSKEKSTNQNVAALLGGSEFVSYLDAIGEIDGQHCLIDWKTTTSAIQQNPRVYSRSTRNSFVIPWISGISRR